MVLRLTVAIERGGQIVDRVERMPRRLPDGSIGFEYQGLVYPVAAPGKVSLDGIWCYPGQAPMCLDLSAEQAADPGRVWDIDRTGSRIYLFIRGKERRLEAATGLMRAAGLPIEHSGPSFRERMEGSSFDWFIRFAPDCTVSDWEIDQILADLPADEALPDPSKDAASASQSEELLRIQRQLAETERQLAKALDALDIHAQSLDRMRARVEEQQAKQEAEAGFLRAALTALEKGNAPGKDGKQIEDIKRRFASLAEDRDAALAAWAHAEGRAAALEEELGLTRTELARAQSQTPNQDAVTAGFRNRLKKWHEELETVLNIFLPDITLARNSAHYILTEVSDRRDLYCKLQLLATDPVSLSGKRVQAARGWLEIHFSTGLGRDGRIYYHQLDTGWHVLVSDKAAQPNDFEWLKAQ